MKAKFSIIFMALLLFFSVSGVEAGNFTDNGNGTVTDNDTGLIWQQGNVNNILGNWDYLIGYCEGLSLAGQTDWRLPNIKELKSIIDYNLDSPAIDQDIFS